MVKKLGLVMVTLVLAVLTGMGCKVDRGSPESVARAFVKAVKKKDTKTILELIPPELNMFVSRDKLLELFNKAESTLKQGRIKYGKAEIHNEESATVPFTIGGKSGMSVKLAYGNGNWYVIELHEDLK